MQRIFKASEVTWPLLEKQLVEIVMPTNLGEKGIEEIKQYLRTINVPIPDPFNWTWSTSFGSLPKRISHHAHLNGINFNSTIMQTLGDIGSKYTGSGKKYLFDITRNIDWNAGDFGDKGSCFWGSNRNALNILQDNWVYAIRLWKEDKSFNEERLIGWARAWLVHINRYPMQFILFNGYGLETYKIARILSSWLNLTYVNIDLTNNGETEETLYINKGKGYIIAAEENLILSYDLRLE